MLGGRPRELGHHDHGHEQQHHDQVDHVAALAAFHAHHHHLPAPVQQVNAVRLTIAFARNVREVSDSKSVVEFDLLEVIHGQLLAVGEHELLLRAETAPLIGSVHPRPHFLFLLDQHEVAVEVGEEGRADAPLHLPHLPHVLHLDGRRWGGREGEAEERQLVELVGHIDVLAITHVGCDADVPLQGQRQGSPAEAGAIIDGLQLAQLQGIIAQQQVGHVIFGLLSNRERPALETLDLLRASTRGVDDVEFVLSGHCDEALLEALDAHDGVLYAQRFLGELARQVLEDLYPIGAGHHERLPLLANAQQGGTGDRRVHESNTLLRKSGQQGQQEQRQEKFSAEKHSGYGPSLQILQRIHAGLSYYPIKITGICFPEEKADG